MIVERIVFNQPDEKGVKRKTILVRTVKAVKK